jgi:transposase
MQPEALFGLALGITPPWEVTAVVFTKEANRIDLTIDFQRGTTFPCPVCGTLSPVHDTKDKEWRHLNFFQYEAYLHARVPRVKCSNKDCGVKLIQVPWARANSGFTLLFEALAMTLARDLPVNVMARLLTVTDKRLWRVLDAYVTMARATEDHSAVSRVGMDETSAKKGHKYVTLFFDLDQRKLLFGTPGKDHETVTAFAADLEQHGGDPKRITDIAIDMSKAFIKGAKEKFPFAVLTFDPFHVIQMMNKTLGKIRAQEARLFPELLNKSRYLFLKNPENLTPEEEQRLNTIIATQNLQSTEAYLYKLNLQNVYFAENRQEAETLLTQWHRQASASRVELIRKVAATVKEHWNGILGHFDSNLNSGFLEGVNSLIQAAKARARGYRDTKNLITMAYLIAGKLKFNSLSGQTAQTALAT